MTIRPGVSTDAAPLAELAARTFYDTFAADSRPEDMVRHTAEAYGSFQQGRELVDPGISTLLAETGDQLAGYAQLRRGPAPACVRGEQPIELWRFYIAREWHGQGVAQALMCRVDAEARLAGANTLWLGVWERNTRAQAFYRKCGFERVGTHIFVLGSDAQTDYIFMRSVAPDVAAENRGPR